MTHFLMFVLTLGGVAFRISILAAVPRVVVAGRLGWIWG